MSQLSESKYICTGGSEIYYKKNEINIELSSKENDFEWLSVRDKNLVGSKIEFDNNKTLCVLDNRSFMVLVTSMKTIDVHKIDKFIGLMVNNGYLVLIKR